MIAGRARAASALALALIVAAAAVLALTALDARYLWDDEAENALLAKSILAVGLPMARDGRHVISQGCGHDADENYLWSFHPWLPMYLTAGSFRLLGVSTLAARLPFALIAVLCVPSLYLAAWRLFRDRTTALLAAGLLGLSVPFLLHARQSRYYALAALAVIWLVYFFRLTVDGSRAGPVGLVAASTVMFQSNHPMFAATLLGLVAGFVLLEFDRRALVRIAAAAGATALLNAPWIAIYGSAWVGAAFGASEASASRWTAAWQALGRFAGYLQQIDVYAMPAVLVLGFFAWALTWGRADVRSSPGGRAALSLVVLALVYVACVAVLPYAIFRYLVTILPVLALLQAWMIRTVGLRRPVLVGALVLLLVGTDLLHGWATRFKWTAGRPRIASALASYVDEITHDFHGPTEAMVALLRASAKPGDRVFISYGDLPLRFYTDLDIRGGQGCDSAVGTLPEWIIKRYFFRFEHPASGAKEDISRTWRFLHHTVPWERYERIELPVVDTIWDSIPDPIFHVFRMPATGPRVIVHRLRKPAGEAR